MPVMLDAQADVFGPYRVTDDFPVARSSVRPKV